MKLGIDFGTTNTVISYFKDNKINLLKINENYLIPSEIYIDKDNEFFFGHQCKNIKNNGFFIKNFKIEIPNNKNYSFNNYIYNINDLLFYYFNYLTKLIRRNLKEKSYECVLSVPSNFNSYSRNIIKNIFEKLNFNIIRIINEPTSASLYYELHLNNKIENKILIIDIGGGTTDFTILEKDEELYEVVNSFGDNRLGGKNITEDIYNYFYKIDNSLTIEKCENLKKNMFKNKIIIKDSELSYNLIKNICKKTINKLKIYLLKIKNMIEDVNEILLIGGSIKFKLFQDIIKETFNKKIINFEDSQSLVSKGSCSFANYLSSKNEIIVMELVQNSIGIETADKNFSIIIPSGIPLPVKRFKKYRKTINDKDDKFELKIFQGENNIASNNNLIHIINMNEFDDEIITVSINLTINNLLEVKINDILIKNNIEISKNIIKKISREEDFILNKNKFLVKERLLILIEKFQKNNLIKIEKKKNIIKYLKNKLKNINNLNLNKLIELKNNLETNFIL